MTSMGHQLDNFREPFKAPRSTILLRVFHCELFLALQFQSQSVVNECKYNGVIFAPAPNTWFMPWSSAQPLSCTAFSKYWAISWMLLCFNGTWHSSLHHGAQDEPPCAVRRAPAWSRVFPIQVLSHLEDAASIQMFPRICRICPAVVPPSLSSFSFMYPTACILFKMKLLTTSKGRPKYDYVRLHILQRI